jgi:hypothetical protein
MLTRRHRTGTSSHPLAMAAARLTMTGGLSSVGVAAVVAATILGVPPMATAVADEGVVAIPTTRVEVAAGVWAGLPDGTLRFDTPQDAFALRPLAGAADWDAFMADVPTAPVSVTIEPFPTGETRLAHRVRAAFMLRAPLEKLRTDETLRRSLGVEQDGKGATSRPLTDDELREAGLTIADADRERLVFLEVPLLNRVTMRGVVRTIATEHPDGVEVAWGFDPRLREHPRWRSTWTRMTENQLGERVESEPQPYLGCGGVVAVRKIGSLDGLDLLAVESRMVLGEPEAWFQGSNLLRSKIPLTVQEGVRTLRRRLAATR